jgi:hypothetical protein
MLKEETISEMAIAQNLMNEILKLPKEKIIEVQDFVEYLRSRSKIEGIPIAEAGLSINDSLELRNRLSTFAEDWDSSRMAAYDKL